MAAALALNARRRRDLGSEVRLLLLNAFAKLEAHEAGDLDRRTDLALGLFQGLCHALLVVEDKRLFQQRDLYEVGLDAGLNDLVDHGGGLALSLELVGENIFLALDGRRIDSC